jgi:magnesium transporter
MDDVRAALRDPGALLWVDIEEAARGEGEQWLRDVFGAHPLTIEDCYDDLLDPPKIDDHGDYLFVIVHHIDFDPGTQSLSASELNIYIGKNYVVSFHRQPSPAVAELRRRLSNHVTFVERGADFLAHALFDITVDRYQPVVESMDDAIADIEERMIERPDRALLAQTMVLRRQAQRLRRSVLPQRDIAARLGRNEYPDVISEAARVYYRDIYDHTVRLEDMLEALREVSESTLNTYLGAVNNRTNEVMKTLAIVTVIFLPLTLIAGIYGTNFDNVPEYGMRYSYASMWIAMGVIVVALLAWFRWRRWI